MRIFLLSFALLFPWAFVQGEETEQQSVAGAPVSRVLGQLGAKQEQGATAEQLDGYSRQFQFLDADRDGSHSKEEYIENGRYLTPQARRGIFSAADTDGDGMVTKAEYTLNRIITDEAKAIVQAMDEDQDGVVQKAEFVSHATEKLGNSEVAETVFEAFDSNGDGTIVVPEYLRVWGRWARAGEATAEQRLAEAAKKRSDDVQRIAELDAYWAEVSRSVKEGDFAGYKATCHPEGVLVAGSSKACYPLAQALERWEQGFNDTKAGKMKASVDFRFSQRLGDSTTAHETGIFCYRTESPDGTTTTDYIHLEALLIKKDGWKIMMEFQKGNASEEEWDAIDRR